MDHTTMAWSVWRHPGTSAGKWRQIPTKDEADARAKYAKEATNLRQGTVELRDPDGKTQSRQTAPRLRSRW